MIKIIIYFYHIAIGDINNAEDNVNFIIDIMLKEYDSNIVEEFFKIEQGKISLTNKGTDEVKKFYQRRDLLNNKFVEKGEEGLTDKEKKEFWEIFDIDRFISTKCVENHEIFSDFFNKNNVDDILDKISEQGINYLSVTEKKILDNYDKKK